MPESGDTGFRKTPRNADGRKNGRHGCSHTSRPYDYPVLTIIPSLRLSRPYDRPTDGSDLTERLFQIGDEVVRILQTDGQADQIGGNLKRGAGHGGVGHGARMLDQGFHAAQGFR